MCRKPPWVVIVFCLFFINTEVKGQEPAAGLMVSHPDVDDAEWAASQQELWAGHEIDLNSASERDLLSIPGMEREEASLIRAYVLRRGGLLNVQELYMMEGMSASRVRELLPYMCVRSVLDDGAWWRVSGRVMHRLGYSGRSLMERAPNYLGKAFSSQLRVTVESSVLRFGLKGIKAPYEPFGGRGAQGGYPSYTYFGQLDFHEGPVRRMIMGDYVGMLGYGLVLSSSSAFQMSPSVLSWGNFHEVRGGLGFSGANLLRGVVLELGGRSNWTILLGGSLKRANGVLMQDKYGKVQIRTFPISGPFITPKSLAHRRSFWERAGWCGTQYAWNHFSLGVSAIWVSLEHKMRTKRYHRRIPHRFLRYGSYFSYHTSRYRTYGELSSEIQWSGSASRLPITFLMGFLWRDAQRWKMGMELYHYGEVGHNYYQAVYAPVSSVFLGGHGLKMQWEYSYWAHTLIFRGELYAGRGKNDRYSKSPQHVRMYGAYEYMLSENLQLGFGLRHLDKVRILGSHRRVTRKSSSDEMHVRFALIPEEGFGFTLRMSGVGNLFGNGNQKWGWAVLQDMSYRGYGWALSGRVGYFHLRGAANALYYYESSPLYMMSIRRHSTNEFRVYLYGKYTLFRSVELWGRLAYSFRSLSQSKLERMPLECLIQVSYKW